MYLVLAEFVERMQSHGKLARLTEGHSCEHLLLMYYVLANSLRKLGCQGSCGLMLSEFQSWAVHACKTKAEASACIGPSVLGCIGSIVRPLYASVASLPLLCPAAAGALPSRSGEAAKDRGSWGSHRCVMY